MPEGQPILQPLARESLADQVYQVIMRYIRQSKVAVGERLPSERKFSELLEVSRSVVRAALARLEREGFVERQVGVGVLLRRRPPSLSFSERAAFDSSSATLAEMYQARIALEVGAMDWVVQGLTEEDLTELETLVDRMAARIAAGQPALREDREFHVRLIAACRNTVIIRFVAIINQYFDQMRFHWPEIPLGRPPDALDVQHRMIVLALRLRDTEAARQAMRLHFRPLRSRFVEVHRDVT